MRPSLLAVLAVVTLAASACSPFLLVKPEAPPITALGAPPDGWAQVCVLRPHWVAWAMTLGVYDNGLLVGATQGDNYFCYFAAPGLHQVVSRIGDPGAFVGPKTLTAAVQPGQRLYLHQNVLYGGFFEVEWVGADQAAEMVPKCGYRVTRLRSGEQGPPALTYAPAAPQTPSMQ